jgi:hypothetical protein
VRNQVLRESFLNESFRRTSVEIIQPFQNPRLNAQSPDQPARELFDLIIPEGF